MESADVLGEKVYDLCWQRLFPVFTSYLLDCCNFGLKSSNILNCLPITVIKPCLFLLQLRPHLSYCEQFGDIMLLGCVAQVGILPRSQLLSELHDLLGHLAGEG